MKKKVVGITETSANVWRVTFNGSVLGDSRGYDRAGALAEAKRYVERNGGIDGDWGPNGWVEMQMVLDPALEPKAEPVADDQPTLDVAAYTIRRAIEMHGRYTGAALAYFEACAAAERRLAATGSPNIRAMAASGARSNEIAADAYREAIAHAAAFGGAGEWEAIKGRLMVHVANLMAGYTESVYPRAAEAAPAAEVAPEAAAEPAVDGWWKWWDGVVAAAAATEQGQAFIAAGFTLWHTGGGCTAWRRDIEGAGKFVMITDGDLGHKLSAEDIANGLAWTVSVIEDEGDGYSEAQETAITSTALGYAEMMTSQVLAGDLAALNWHAA